MIDGGPLATLSAELPPPLRLAVAYAPPGARGPWTALLLLDRRLGRAALTSREPLVGQIKLAWWRDRLAEPTAQWPVGEPLLALLARWDAERVALAALVDAWEGLVGGEAGAIEIAGLAEARAAAIAALARLLGCADAAERAREAALGWALDDLAARLGSAAARELPANPRPRPPLPRPLRPLTVLAELAAHGEGGGVRRLARIVRLGLIGR